MEISFNIYNAVARNFTIRSFRDTLPGTLTRRPIRVGVSRDVRLAARRIAGLGKSSAVSQRLVQGANSVADGLLVRGSHLAR